MRCATSPAHHAATCSSATASCYGSPCPFEAGELDAGRQGAAWATREWAPVEGDPAAAPVTTMRATDGRLTRRARQAMQRRGCRSLAWGPMVLHGELVGAIELSDAGDRDFSRHADAIQGLARICAEATAVQRTMDELAHRDKTVRELVDLSREVAQTHDFERFVVSFAQRLLTAAGADCVDVWRASGGVIRLVVSCTRDGVDTSVRDRILDTARYPSLERTLLDYSPLAIGDLRDERLGEDEREGMRGWGFASSLTMPLVAGGELVGLVDLYDDAGTRLEPGPRVPHQRVPTRRRRVRQHRAPRRSAGDRPTARGAHRAGWRPRGGRGAGGHRRARGHTPA